MEFQALFVRFSKLGLMRGWGKLLGGLEKQQQKQINFSNVFKKNCKILILFILSFQSV